MKFTQNIFNIYLGKTFSTFKMQTFVCGVCDTFVSLSSLSLLSIILFDVTLFSFQGTTLNMSYSFISSWFMHIVEKSAWCVKLLEIGGDEENRTPDPLLARQVLSQLSYTPRFKWRVNSEKWRVMVEMLCISSFPLIFSLLSLIWNSLRNFFGGPKWTRTTDLTLIRRAL